MDIEELPQNEAVEEIPHLRFLRLLVSVLAGTMIVGLLVLIVLIVIRFREDRVTPTVTATVPLPALPTLPETIHLPDDAHPVAVTAGPGWYLILMQDGRAMLFDLDGTRRGTAQFDLPKG